MRNRDYTLISDGPPERYVSHGISATFFDALGVQAELGRTFRRGEDEPGQGEERRERVRDRDLAERDALEQREGRVHRYKGHAVRRNLATRYGSVGRESSGDPWATMFAAACDDRPSDQNEIWPYWVFAPEASNGTTARIERYVPALGLSRDRAWADELQRMVALYRLAFGQPRQDDLLAYLNDQIDPADLERLIDDLRIDLGPR